MSEKGKGRPWGLAPTCNWIVKGCYGTRLLVFCSRVTFGSIFSESGWSGLTQGFWDPENLPTSCESSNWSTCIKPCIKPCINMTQHIKAQSWWPPTVTPQIWSTFLSYSKHQCLESIMLSCFNQSKHHWNMAGIYGPGIRHCKQGTFGGMKRMLRFSGWSPLKAFVW